MLLLFWDSIMSANFKHAIKSTRIATLENAMQKEKEMEEDMLESNVDPVVILGKGQRQMTYLIVSNQTTTIPT